MVSSSTQPMVEFVLVRHGQTESNAAKVIQGQLPGKLTPKGEEQAAKVGLRFQKEQAQFTQAHVSDLGRTQQTFQQISQYIQIQPVINEPLLREKAAGVFEGQAYGSQAREAKRLNIPVRKYKPQGGESHDEVLARAIKFITQICDNFIPKQQPGQNARVLVVTHGGFIAEFLNACKVFLGRPITLEKDSAYNGGIYVIQFQRNAKQGLKPKVVVENDTTHLNVKL